MLRILIVAFVCVSLRHCSTLKSERDGSFVGDTDSCIPKYVMSRPIMRFCTVKPRFTNLIRS